MMKDFPTAGLVVKESRMGVDYAIAEHDGVRRFFATALPQRGTTLSEQAEDLFGAMEGVLKEQGCWGSTVMQSVFLKNTADREACRQMVARFHGGLAPATSYIVQPPCDGSLLAMEAWAMVGTREPVLIDRASEGLAVVGHAGITWAFVADVRPRTTASSTYARSASAFQALDQRLQSAGLRLDHVLRTWIYLGGITAAEGDTQRYRELNRARTECYRDCAFGGELLRSQRHGSSDCRAVFPASTGIGAGDGLVLSCVALQTQRSDVFLFPLENPRQTAACDYGRSYGEESPKFARAMAVITPGCVTTFISGTASITASETQHDTDIERQTRQSLDNIEALVAEDNFRRHGLSGHGATLQDLVLARVYLKRREDYAVVRAICRERLGDLPILYGIGDICRPELLIEIEALAVTPLGATGRAIGSSRSHNRRETCEMPE
jgi:enamine deaminase RidA (YjgF/YER057c/UK114 family)